MGRDSKGRSIWQSPTVITLLIVGLIAVVVVLSVLQLTWIGEDREPLTVAEIGTPHYVSAAGAAYVLHSHAAYLDWRGPGTGLLHGDFLGDMRVMFELHDQCVLLSVRDHPALVMVVPNAGFICKRSSHDFVVGGFGDGGQQTVDINAVMKGARPRRGATPITLDIKEQWVMHAVSEDHRRRVNEKIALDVDAGSYCGLIEDATIGTSQGWVVEFTSGTAAAMALLASASADADAADPATAATTADGDPATGDALAPADAGPATSSASATSATSAIPAPSAP